ncbi:putative lipid II flippase MurJ [Steroidobacter agaridevorans]|uniref:Probable lipid II flippase MurJ n=1 Tax=Steroidobacter agaridevorans TaxID=2695856 RepID=A0A829YMF9_9GAMM|nr:murein biosynthesis integral membrane protein MurJ [Steroidobacter agaridevorans]GFE84634.1 putative lipid II flippase MurJ [Steroidobacter agaridevorans]GFE91035.1 putative lipid II flippase MurJ [Steroidobacter agaridevorans]
MSRGFFRSTAIVGITTLLSRITGLVRDVVQAVMIPAVYLEVYVLANQIPNLLRRLFAEGAFSQAFVPVVAEYKANRSKEDVRELVDSVSGTLGAFLAVVSVIGVIAAPIVVTICAPGFASKEVGQFGLAVEMLRWTFPYLLFVSLTALAGGVLNSYQQFALPAFTSVVLNIVLIVFAAYVSPYFEQPVVALAVGVFVGGVIQLIIQIPALIKLGVIRRPHWNWQHEAVKRIARLMGPAIIGSSMGQLSVMISSGIASLLADGSMTWLYYADRLVEFPLGVFSIALATVILPSLSSQHARKSPDEFSATLAWAVRLVCLIVIPASVAMFAMSGPLTVALLHYGQFKATDVAMTRMALMAFSLALLGWSMIKVLATGYYAQQNTKGPVKVAMRALGVTMVLNVIVVVALWLTGNLKTPGAHTLLALTNGVGAIMNAGLLYLGLLRSQVLRRGQAMRGLLIRIAVASVLMAAFLWWFGGDITTWLVTPTLQRVVWLAGLVVGGIGVYFAALWAMGVRAGQFRLQSPASSL